MGSGKALPHSGISDFIVQVPIKLPGNTAIDGEAKPQFLRRQIEEVYAALMPSDIGA